MPGMQATTRYPNPRDVRLPRRGLALRSLRKRARMRRGNDAACGQFFARGRLWILRVPFLRYISGWGRWRRADSRFPARDPRDRLRVAGDTSTGVGARWRRPHRRSRADLSFLIRTERPSRPQRSASVRAVSPVADIKDEIGSCMHGQLPLQYERGPRSS